MPNQDVRELRNAARFALQKYGIRDCRLSFVEDCKQSCFRVRTNDDAASSHGEGYLKGTYLLRMYPAGSRPPGVIRSESQWLRSILKETRIVVPEPVENAYGDEVTKVSSDGTTWHCFLTRWVEGRFYLRKNGPGPSALRRIGRVMAELHIQGQHFKRPRGFRCPRWNWENLFGNESPYYPGIEKDFLDKKGRRLFSGVATQTRKAMAKLGTKPDVFGLIHGDLIQVNYLFHKGEARVIDFGDFGYGYHLFDIAVTLFALWGRDGDLRQRHAFLNGYREIRDLSDSHEKQLDLFIAARGVLLSRLAIDAIKRDNSVPARDYVTRVLEGIRIWMGES